MIVDVGFLLISWFNRLFLFCFLLFFRGRQDQLRKGRFLHVSGGDVLEAASHTDTWCYTRNATGLFSYCCIRPARKMWSRGRGFQLPRWSETDVTSWSFRHQRRSFPLEWYSPAYHVAPVAIQRRAAPQPNNPLPEGWDESDFYSPRGNKLHRFPRE